MTACTNCVAYESVRPASPPLRLPACHSTVATTAPDTSEPTRFIVTRSHCNVRVAAGAGVGARVRVRVRVRVGAHLVGGPQVVEAAVGIVHARVGEGEHAWRVTEGAHHRGARDHFR